ncbi:MAG: DUF4854 domain-containing protein [Acetatifactor sp.]|nr:DUF4854 domain-containing protein [Acetatifactor sp.]
MKKKILALAMTLALVLFFSACGKMVKSGNSTTESGKAFNAETFKDGVFNNKGSVIYEQDSTEDYEPSASGDSTLLGAYDDLQAWIESDEAVLTVEAMNNVLASTGMTIDFSADGNTLVYEYYMSDETYQSSGLENYSEDELQSYIESVAESQRATIESGFKNFDNNYGITLDAVRAAFYKADGTLIVSIDILNDIY